MATAHAIERSMRNIRLGIRDSPFPPSRRASSTATAPETRTSWSPCNGRRSYTLAASPDAELCEQLDAALDRGRGHRSMPQHQSRRALPAVAVERQTLEADAAPRRGGQQRRLVDV